MWFGLRSNPDGTCPGLPVVILGGDHLHLPVEETAVRALARILVAERISAVLDLSAPLKVCDGLEEVYRVNRDPMHIVIDEADLLSPQQLRVT